MKQTRENLKGQRQEALSFYRKLVLSLGGAAQTMCNRWSGGWQGAWGPGGGRQGAGKQELCTAFESSPGQKHRGVNSVSVPAA